MTYTIGNALDVLPTLDAGRFRCCVTSPPYWGLRDYGHADQLGLEPTPGEYVAKLVRVFREVRRVLADDGTLWLNIGDCYAGSGRGGYAGGAGTLDGSVDGQDGARQARIAQARPRAGYHDTQVSAGVTGRKWTKPPPGVKNKSLVGIPWRVALALQDDGWILRSDIIWDKSNAMPSSVKDRPTLAHEYVFLLTKSGRYFYDSAAASEPSTWKGQGRSSRAPASSAVPGAPSHRGIRADKATGRRNLRSVWRIGTQPFKGAHFAAMPPSLAERCIRAGSAVGDEVLDPFLGSGTVGMVAEALGRRWHGIELQPDYAPLIDQRTARGPLLQRVA